MVPVDILNELCNVGVWSECRLAGQWMCSKQTGVGREEINSKVVKQK